MRMGVTAIQIYPDLSRRLRITGLKYTNPEELWEIEQLKLQMSIMKKTIDSLMAGRWQQNFSEYSPRTLMEPGIHLSPDQFFRMMASIERSNINECTPNNITTPSPTININSNQALISTLY
ncbi:hypothetical protein KSP39_PZI016439 [Platanthera zijinensis]|uniref:Uncharacterized protein n=1 Tax=Platanthera zijinensis TaxID=2320716 RepID=A0AAP0B6Z1_9ASPA